MTTSVHRRAHRVRRIPRPTVSLRTKFLEKIHHGLFASLTKSPIGDGLGFLKQLFGLGHLFSHRFVDAKNFGSSPSCNSSCNSMNFF